MPASVRRQVTLPLSSLLIAAALLVTGLTAWQASANRETSAMAPSVGLVNVEAVINQAQELTAFNGRLKTEVEAMQVELNDLADQLTRLQADLEEIPATDRQRRREIRKQMFEVSARAEVRKRILQNDIDTRKGEAVKNVYEKMLAAIGTIAQREGIDVVLFDDRGITIPDGLVETQVNSLIQARRVLYGSDAADLTQRVLALLNENFAAGR